MRPVAVVPPGECSPRIHFLHELGEGVARADRVISRESYLACGVHAVRCSRRLLSASVMAHREVSAGLGFPSPVDLVDAVPAVFQFGINRAWLRSLFEELPRDGLYRTIAPPVSGMLRSRPRHPRHDPSHSPAPTRTIGAVLARRLVRFVRHCERAISSVPNRHSRDAASHRCRLHNDEPS